MSNPGGWVIASAGAVSGSLSRVGERVARSRPAGRSTSRFARSMLRTPADASFGRLMYASRISPRTPSITVAPKRCQLYQSEAEASDCPPSFIAAIHVARQARAGGQDPL